MIVRRFDGSVACCYITQLDTNDKEILQLAMSTLTHLVPLGSAITFGDWIIAIKQNYALSNPKTAEVVSMLERLALESPQEAMLLTTVTRKELAQLTDVDVCRALWLLKDQRRSVATLVCRVRPDLRQVVEMVMREDFPQKAWVAPAM